MVRNVQVPVEDFNSKMRLNDDPSNEVQYLEENEAKSRVKYNGSQLEDRHVNLNTRTTISRYILR